MVLDLSRLFESDDENELKFSFSIDLSDFEQSGVRPLKKPVSVSGRAEVSAGVITVSYTALYTVDTLCDRCGCPVSQERSVSCSRTAVKSMQNEDNEDYLLAPEGRLALDEPVYCDVVLDLPSKNLCREDCLGLCPTCGENRNITPCSCSHYTGDPRLQRLAELLEQ